MTNDNNEINLEKETSQIAPTKEFFQEVVADLPEDKVKKEIPNLDKASKEDTIEPVKTATDQEKINAYDELKVKDLPQDWKAQLLRLKHLETELSNYTKTSEELKGWTDTFTDKQPNEVQAEITNLEETKKTTEETLNSKITELEADLAKSVQEKQNLSTTSEQKIKDLEQELNEWKGTWNNRELKEVKEEWDLLKQRPDIAVSTTEFYQHYAKRPSLAKISELEQELAKEKDKVIALVNEKTEIQKAIDLYLENESTKKYILAESLSTPEQAQQAIAKLLESVKQKWMNYLDANDNLVEQELKLGLSLREEGEKSRAQQIVAWIEEAQTTQEYQKLFERWTNGQEFNQKYDYDAGSLRLLGKYLEVNQSTELD